MAQADTLVALVKAASSGDQPSFRKSTEALIQEERGKGHRILADRLEKALRAPVHQPAFCSSDTTSPSWGYSAERSDCRVDTRAFAGKFGA